MPRQIISSKIQTATVMLPNLSQKERNHAGSGSEESMPHNCSSYTHLCITMRIYNVWLPEKPFLQPLCHPKEPRGIIQARSVSLDTSSKQYVQF
jgi:hypothetical protein